jgi:hypothetical protein
MLNLETKLEPLNPLSLTPSKTPPFFSQLAKLQNFFETRAEREKPLFRVEPSTKEMTVKLEKVLAV